MIYLMRHGQSTTNIDYSFPCRRLEGDLTDKGRTQAEKAARWFIGKGITKIRYSPFHRAQQTAEIVAAMLGIIPELDDDLREADCGNVETLTFEEALPIWRRIYVRWLLFDEEARFPDGESYGEAIARLTRALSRVAPDEKVLLVTHGDITHTVIPPLCVNANELGRVPPLDNTGIIVLEHYDADRYSCSAWNLAEHLSD